MMYDRLPETVLKLKSKALHGKFTEEEIMNYTNPIIKGFHPDPSVCHVGDDYYLVTSTFEYFPGIPVYHSRDLVNWKMIGHCIDRAGQLPMETALPSGGIWAPTIRYDNGTFYVTATFSGKGNFLVKSCNPAGPYSDPVWVEMDGIDPSIYFENGRLYYCANDCGSRENGNGGNGISLAEINPDTGKVIGQIKRIWNGEGGGWLEGPHIYHIRDYYYLLAAEGGTGAGHMAVLARCRELFGAYETCPFNPVLTNRNDISKSAWCCGHADLTEDAEGNSFFVHLGTRPVIGGKSNLGRETFLTPVVWRDDWFYAIGKKAQIAVTTPGKAVQSDRKAISVDFNHFEWEPQWLFIKKRVEAYYKRGNGRLTLVPSESKLTNRNGLPTFAGIRQPDFNCTVSTIMDFEPQANGVKAGIAVYLSPEYLYQLYKCREDNLDFIVVEKYADDFHEIAYKEKIDSGTLRLIVEADEKKYSFYLETGGARTFLAAAATRFLTCELNDKCFTGTLIGFFAESEPGRADYGSAQKKTAAEASFQSFTAE